MTTYEKGELVRASAAFTDDAEADVDPTAVNFSVSAPDGTTTTYTFGTDAELVRDSAGHYHVDVDADATGTWSWRFFSTGDGQAASEGQFFVKSLF